jgi:hypothetical protein
MKRETIGLVMGGVLLVCAAGAMQQADRPGRFQIVEVNQRTAVIDKDGDIESSPERHPVTLLLNTETGETRILRYVVDKRTGSVGAWGKPLDFLSK